MTCFTTMRRTKCFSFGIVFAIVVATGMGSPRDGSGLSEDVRVGSGHAYAILGEMPVKHRDRVKPLGSMAIEEVKRIHGHSTISFLGSDGRTRSSWEPVAALLDWSVRPEFWDDREFILVDYPPLKRLLLTASIREQVRDLADMQISESRRSLEALAAQPDLTAADLRKASQQAGEASTIRKSLSSWADKLGNDSRWLSPRLLEKTKIYHEGRTLTFPQWVGEILDKKERARTGQGGAAPKLTPIEDAATEVGERLFHYKAIREHNSPAIKPLDLQVVPRPDDEFYRKYSADTFQKGMKANQTLSPLEANVAITMVEYLQDIPSKDWALPGEDAVFDQKFTAWLDLNQAWSEPQTT